MILAGGLLVGVMVFASCAPPEGTVERVQRQTPSLSLEGGTQYIAMDVGDAHGCVVRADRQISCWDLNDPRNPGQAGASDPPTSSVAVLFDFPLP